MNCTDLLSHLTDFFDKKLSSKLVEEIKTHTAGCQHCRDVWHALRTIAQWIIPKEHRDSNYEIAPFDQSIRYNEKRMFRPDVSLRIGIRHRSGFDRPVDACEVRCLNEMTQKLKEIGARKGKWKID